MALVYQLVTVDVETNNFMSGVKYNTPKMFNALKNSIDVLEKMFNRKYKVRRVISTKYGYKFI